MLMSFLFTVPRLCYIMRFIQITYFGGGKNEYKKQLNTHTLTGDDAKVGDIGVHLLLDGA